MKDSFGNEFEIEIKKEGNKIIRTITYTLPEGKTTLKEEHPKFKEGKACAFPERQSCNYNYEIDVARCEFMKFIEWGNWHCTFKKE